MKKLILIVVLLVVSVPAFAGSDYLEARVSGIFVDNDIHEKVIVVSKDEGVAEAEAQRILRRKFRKAVALEVGKWLPRDEALDFLMRVMGSGFDEFDYLSSMGTFRVKTVETFTGGYRSVAVVGASPRDITMLRSKYLQYN